MDKFLYVWDAKKGPEPSYCVLLIRHLYPEILMRKSSTSLLVVLLCLFFVISAAGGAFGQDPEVTPEEPEKKEKKEKTKAEKPDGGGGEVIKFKGTPAKIIEQADALFVTRRYVEAEEGYRQALEKDPNCFHCMYRVALCNEYFQNYKESVKWFESAIALDPNRNDTAYFKLGLSYKMLDRYNDAREMFEKFRKKYTENDDYFKRVDLEIKGCDFAEKEREKDPLYKVWPVNINTSSSDLFPMVLNQNGVDSFLVFMSYRAESFGNDMYTGAAESSFSDLWKAPFEDDSTLGVSENLGKQVNTKQNDGTSSFTSDGMTMYYAICNQGKRGYGCSIYQSNYDPRKKAWGKAQLIEGLNGKREVVINSRGKTKEVPTWDAHPSLSADGMTMFFVSDREGGWGGLDIWYSIKQGEEWSEPVNAGPNINTAFNDMSPYLNKTGDRIVFASDGRVGMGGLDLFVAEGSIGNWKEPKNLGIPINSSYDDFASTWVNKDSTAIFTSNRPQKDKEEEGPDHGRDDIYFARMIPPPPITVAVHGVIRDKKSKQPVPFALVMLFKKTDEGELIPVDTFQTDQSANYNFPLEIDKEYKIVANAPEYLANEENLNTFGLKEDTDFEKNIDIYLERIIIAFPIVLNNIYYDFDYDTLRKESKEELQGRLKKTMDDNPQIVIEIGSHTDSNGSEKYNKDLSERRAKSVVKYLVGLGVKADRLSWYGYGESDLLIYPELTDEDEQLNRRSEFRIMAIDYGDK